MKLLLSLVVVSAALAVAPLSSKSSGAALSAVAQDKPAPETQDGEGRRAWPWGTKEEAERIQTQMVGTWRLVSVRRSAQTFDGAACEGYMLVQPEHLSLQARLSAPSGALRDVFIEGFSAGVYRWRYDGARLKVAVSTLLAANDFNDELEWEDAGLQREYDVLVNDDTLSLTRPGESQFDFVRVRPTARPKER